MPRDVGFASFSVICGDNIVPVNPYESEFSFPAELQFRMPLCVSSTGSRMLHSKQPSLQKYMHIVKICFLEIIYHLKWNFSISMFLLKYFLMWNILFKTTCHKGKKNYIPISWNFQYAGRRNGWSAWVRNFRQLFQRWRKGNYFFRHLHMLS